ncbi:MAG: hydroxymethylbilane synthase [Acidimicrobiales bacterium]|nr:hydroxymethylbilane synthase [Acidimicrobiales bacterium]
MTAVLRLATRASALARWQAEHVAALLQQAAHNAGSAIRTELLPLDTTADRRLEVPISAMGGKGVFVKEIQQAVLDGRADLAVHSAKDLPGQTPDGLVLAAVPQRADPRDVLVGSELAALGPGAPVATGSVRRRVQLADLRPDLTFVELRGNIGTRLEKVPDGGAIVMAAAAIDRLGLWPEITLRGLVWEVFEPQVLVPQVGQGALAVEVRDGEDEILELVRAIEHAHSRWTVDAERAFLAALGGDCDLPAGAHATVLPDGSGVVLDAMLASLDGHVVLRHRDQGPEASELGRAVADHLVNLASATNGA